ncbi:aminotransferase class IV [Roseivirga sp. 4D4]|uniref:aminotransferase class IV n=1 Tax=Roseivirga sp. 4D4 TaxID=1889784 RepID=UPI00147C9EDD|nr:aminotransferase class IV [Roseivirga sp. 4D4]
MKAIFNSRIIETSDYLIKTSNRSFCYGDGLFETIVTGHGRINLIEKHIHRLKRGCKVLGMEFPNDLEMNSLETMIQKLQAINGFDGDIRTKVIVWRDSGGLYTPNLSSASFSLEVKASNSILFQGIDQVDVSSEIHTQYSPISFAKTTNALVYVLAGLEKKENGLDEVILTDPNGNLSETHISNLFWIKESKVYTPSLTTGCIEGIMRNTLIDLFHKNNIAVHEVEKTKEALRDASSVFSTNASGIKYLKRIGNWNYESPENFLTPIIKQLQQP